MKAGCVAPGTTVVTERGVVTADEAVKERHEQILSYDRDTGQFEMRRIEQHMTTHVPQAENIRIKSGDVTLTTSIKHPVLVYRDDDLRLRPRRRRPRPMASSAAHSDGMPTKRK
ncbi:MAG: hypothetical protein U5O39_12275 [Gammaproteobacteria bacterium]|nr:hypothetical protein [Gammaproteobacteria bacterium]